MESPWAQQRGGDRTCAGTAQSQARWEPGKQREELQGVSRAAGVTDQEEGGRERRGNASRQVLCAAIFR